MAFDEEMFEGENFWTTLIEKINIVLGKITKAMSIKLKMKQSLTVKLPVELQKKNIKMILRPKKYIGIRLRRK